jgi:hypothetical protein
MCLTEKVAELWVGSMSHSPAWARPLTRGKDSRVADRRDLLKRLDVMIMGCGSFGPIRCVKPAGRMAAILAT